MGEAGAFLIIWHPPVGNAVLGVPRSRTLGFGSRRANPQPLPFRRQTLRQTPTLGEFANVLRIRPTSFHVVGAAARKGQALSLQEDGCGFAGGLYGSWVLLRGVPGRHALQPGRFGFAGGGVMPLAGAAGDVEDAIPYRGAAVDSPKGVLCRRCCCAERRGRRSLPGGCGFAGGGRKPSAGAAGDVGDAIPYGGCADSPEVGPGRGCCCAEGASPFPTTGVGADSPGVCKTGGLLRGVPGSARPTGVVRIRPAMFCVVGVCRAGTRPSWFCPGRL